ncbi:MAG: OmpH family outer membrane protein [Nitrospirota bacterium]|nr:OmpH family outer membrane protein [Nitrospirota bacterium]
MKKVVIYAVMILLLPLLGTSFAKDMKVGFVDSEKVFSTSDEGVRVQKNVEEFVQSRQTIVDLAEKELRQLEDDFKIQASLLSPDAVKMKQEEMQKKFSQYQKKAREMNKEVQDKKLETSNSFFKSLESAIKTLSKKEGYDFVLNKTREGGAVLFSNDADDITDKIIAQLNETTKK